jgi:hypothetical protein
MSAGDAVTDHSIVRLVAVPTGGQNWHRVECACSWSRRYVSRYRAEVMHQHHAKLEDIA